MKFGDLRDCRYCISIRSESVLLCVNWVGLQRFIRFQYAELFKGFARFWAGSHEFRVIKRDEIFSLAIPKLPADYI